MGKFNFKLEPLFEYRLRLEEICRKEFSEAMHRLGEEEARLAFMKESYRRYSDEMDALKEKSEDVQGFSLYYDYFKGLKRHIEEQDRIIEKVREELEARRVELLEASKKKKVIEIMKEKSYEAYAAEMEKTEQKTTDDLVNSRFKRSEQ